MKGTFLVLTDDGTLKRIDRQDAEFKASDRVILRVSPQNKNGDAVRIHVIRNDFDPDESRRRFPHSLRRRPNGDE